MRLRRKTHSSAFDFRLPISILRRANLRSCFKWILNTLRITNKDQPHNDNSYTRNQRWHRRQANTITISLCVANATQRVTGCHRTTEIGIGIMERDLGEQRNLVNSSCHLSRSLGECSSRSPSRCGFVSRHEHEHVSRLSKRDPSALQQWNVHINEMHRRVARDHSHIKSSNAQWRRVRQANWI